jgi:hypothetical protein
MNPVDIVETQLAAYNARDIGAFAATYAEDVRIFRGGSLKPKIVGREAIKVQYGTKTFMKEGLNAKILSRMAVGNKVIDHERTTWAGNAVPMESIVVYEVVNDLIQNVWFFNPNMATKFEPGI